MSLRARFAILALNLVIASAFASVAATAAGEPDSDGTTSLDAVDSGRTHALDDVDTGRTKSLDSVDTGTTDSLDSADTGRTHSLDSADMGRTNSLDSTDSGHTYSLDTVEATEGAWQPPSCSGIDVALGDLPAGPDADAWSDVLFVAQQNLKTAKYELEKADAAYSRAMNSATAVGAERKRVVEARDEARENYTRSHCAMPRLVEHARRAGVLPGVLRRYEGSPANSE